MEMMQNAYYQPRKIFEKIERNETRNKILIDIRKRKSLEKIVSYKNWPKLFIYSYSSLSLKYVSFESQLLAKSGKSVFVVLTGKIVSNTNYKLYKYLYVCLIALGIFLFSDINRNREPYFYFMFLLFKK